MIIKWYIEEKINKITINVSADKWKLTTFQYIPGCLGYI